MKRLTQDALQKVLESEIIGESAAMVAEYAGLSIDSRTIRRGEIFFAIIGDNNDGHEYITQAFEKGATAVVVNKDRLQSIPVNPNQPVFAVDDTHEALMNLAGYLRRTSDARFAAVTGSNGKTTTKEMLYTILSQKYQVYRSPGNLNNLYGLPISLGRMPEVPFAVFELGISVPGEMTRLARIVKPDLAIFTNIGPAHLETMRNLEAVVQAKFELVDNLPVGAAIILNVDDEYLRSEAQRRGLQYIGYSIERESVFKAENVHIRNGLQVSFTIQGIEITVESPGRINVYNALAAIAASSVWSCGGTEWRAGLAAFRPIDMRLSYEEHDNLKYLIDCYNANPESSRAALEVVRDFETQGRKIAIMADMLELGDDSEKLHRRIGGLVADSDLDLLFCFGEMARFIGGGAREKGFAEKNIYYFTEHQKLLDELLRQIVPGDLILFKGSRGMALEKIVTGLKGTAFKSN